MPPWKSSGGSLPFSGATTANLITLGGSGTDADPFHGYYYYQALNFNAAGFNVAPPIPKGDSTFVWLKSIQVGYTNAAVGAVYYATMGVQGTGAGAIRIIPEVQVTETTTDIYREVFPDRGLLMWWPPNTSAYGAWAGVLAFAISGYAATDDIEIVLELYWTV